MAIEIVSFPNSMVSFHSYVSLPEGNFVNIVQNLNLPFGDIPWYTSFSNKLKYHLVGNPYSTSTPWNSIRSPYLIDGFRVSQFQVYKYHIGG